MQKLFSIVFLFIFFLLCQTSAPAQIRIVNKLAEVKTIFVDEQSFKITSSSCGQNVGGMFIPCRKDNEERAKFFVDLKRWLGKYGFTLIDDRQQADAVLQGTILIDDDVFQKQRDYKKIKSKQKKNEPYIDSSYNDPRWSVTAWLINDYDEKIWFNNVGFMPGLSYGWSDLPKIEAKKLARKLQYDHKKAK